MRPLNDSLHNIMIPYYITSIMRWDTYLICESFINKKLYHSNNICAILNTYDVIEALKKFGIAVLKDLIENLWIAVRIFKFVTCLELENIIKVWSRDSQCKFGKSVIAHCERVRIFVRQWGANLRWKFRQTSPVVCPPHQERARVCRACVFYN